MSLPAERLDLSMVVATRTSSPARSGRAYAKPWSPCTTRVQSRPSSGVDDHRRRAVADDHEGEGGRRDEVRVPERLRGGASWHDRTALTDRGGELADLLPADT